MSKIPPFYLGLLAIVLIATAYEFYKPLGVALATIALVTMFLVGKDGGQQLRRT